MKQKLTRIEQRINPETGKAEDFLLSSIIERNDEPPWIKLFVTLTDQIVEDFGNTRLAVYFWFVQKVLESKFTGESPQFVFLPGGYKTIAKKLQMTERAIAGHVRDLVKMGYLAKPNKNNHIYLIPARLLCRGELKKVEQIQMAFDYDLFEDSQIEDGNRKELSDGQD